MGCINRDLPAGRKLHCLIISNGMDDASDENGLIQLFAHCGSLFEASLVFSRIAKLSALAWHSIISAHALVGENERALELFSKMQQDDIKPDKSLFLCAMKVVSQLKWLSSGRLAHMQILKSSLETDVAIGSTLIHMYCNCGSLCDARKVFDILPNRNVVSWNAMIIGCIQHQQKSAAFELFMQMQDGGVKPSKFTFSCILKACAILEQGKLIHEQIISGSLESDAIVGTALIDMYAKFGRLEQAHKVFDNLLDRDLVSWNAIIAGYAQHKDCSVALKLFKKMQRSGLKPDKMTLSSILNACGTIGAIEEGRMLHREVILNNFDSDLIVMNSLIDMYAKCGNLQEAQKLLNELHNRDLVSWNIMLAGYAQYGNSRMIRSCLEDMVEDGFKPDQRSFISVLSTCSHAGQIVEGSEYFTSMAEDYGFTGDMEHLNCMVDLLGRAGCLHEAESLVQSLPLSPSTTAWTSLLAACTEHSNVLIGKQCFDQAFGLDPKCGTSHVLMSNICVQAGILQDAFELQEQRKASGAWKKIGRVWIEVDRNVYEFLAGDNNHELVLAKLQKLQVPLKGAGYMPQLDLILAS